METVQSRAVRTPYPLRAGDHVRTSQIPAPKDSRYRARHPLQRLWSGSAAKSAGDGVHPQRPGQTKKADAGVGASIWDGKILSLRISFPVPRKGEGRGGDGHELSGLQLHPGSESDRRPGHSYALTQEKNRK